MTPRMLKALLFSVAAIGFASPAAAEVQVDALAPASTDFVSLTLPPPYAAVAPEAQGLDAPVADEILADQRGGQTIQLTNQTMTAITSGNVLNGDYVAGAVTLSDNALSNFNGVGNLLINTGAQVSLQTGMNFTINVSGE
jgi:hypothetical protein